MGSGITYGNKMMEKPSYISSLKYEAAYSTQRERYLSGISMLQTTLYC